MTWQRGHLQLPGSLDQVLGHAREPDHVRFIVKRLEALLAAEGVQRLVDDGDGELPDVPMLLCTPAMHGSKQTSRNCSGCMEAESLEHSKATGEGCQTCMAFLVNSAPCRRNSMDPITGLMCGGSFAFTAVGATMDLPNIW